MRKLQSGKWFQSARPSEGIQYIDGEHVAITNIEAVEAVDEYDNVDCGFRFDAVLATEAEIKAWKEARRAKRRGRSVWQMIEDETSER